MKKIKVPDVLYWAQVFHTVAAWIIFVAVPTMRYVYFGDEAFWVQWQSMRVNVMWGYLTANIIITSFSSLVRYG